MNLFSFFISIVSGLIEKYIGFQSVRMQNFIIFNHICYSNKIHALFINMYIWLVMRWKKVFLLGRLSWSFNSMLKERDDNTKDQNCATFITSFVGLVLCLNSVDKLYQYWYQSVFCYINVHDCIFFMFM